MSGFQRLSLLIKAWYTLFFFRLSIWFLPFQKVKGLACKMSVHQSSRDDFTQVIKSVNRVRFFVPRATCLSRALTAQVLLVQSGHTVELCIGFAKTPAGQVEAHAWLEKDGVVVMNNLEHLSNFVKVSQS